MREAANKRGLILRIGEKPKQEDATEFEEAEQAMPGVSIQMWGLFIFGDGVQVSYDPPKHGNCQFHCTARELRNLMPDEFDACSHIEVRRDCWFFE